MISENDWRLQGQERFLKGKTLTRKKYTCLKESWEHDHCEFCSNKFSDKEADTLKVGYVTEDNYHWICEVCYDDFKNMFKWNLSQPS